LRKALEKDAIKQYTVIPDLSYLGFDIIAFTIARSKELVEPLWEEGKKWAANQPNVLYLSTGQGIDGDAIMVTVHTDYADFIKFYHVFRSYWSKHLEDFKIFLISVRGSIQMKAFSFNCLVDALQKKNQR
jgi:hypothetical protein